MWGAEDGYSEEQQNFLGLWEYQRHDPTGSQSSGNIFDPVLRKFSLWQFPGTNGAFVRAFRERKLSLVPLWECLAINYLPKLKIVKH